MDSTIFRNLIDPYHQRWLSKNIGIAINKKLGVDLLGEDIAVELKSRLNKYWPAFAIHEKQFQNYKQQHPNLFYAFLYYDLRIEVENIPPCDSSLEKFVIGRKAFIVPSSLIESMEVHYSKTGPYRYIHERDFEKINLQKVELNINNVLFISERLEDKIRSAFVEPF